MGGRPLRGDFVPAGNPFQQDFGVHAQAGLIAASRNTCSSTSGWAWLPPIRYILPGQAHGSDGTLLYPGIRVYRVRGWRAGAVPNSRVISRHLRHTVASGDGKLFLARLAITVKI